MSSRSLDIAVRYDLATTILWYDKEMRTRNVIDTMRLTPWSQSVRKRAEVIDSHSKIPLTMSAASDDDLAVRTWKCMCGSFEGQVTGDPAFSCWCHCKACRQQSSSAMHLGIFPNFKVLKGDDNLIKYEHSEGIFRNSCRTCGSFCYKVAADGAKVAPLGALEGGPAGAPALKASCHIMCAHKGDNDIMFPEHPQHDEFPAP